MVSEYLIAEANKDVSSDPLLTLLTVTHTLLIPPFRCVLNGEPFVSRGETYVATPFAFLPPEQTQDGLKAGRLRIENVESNLIELLRGVAGTSDPPQATFEFVYASAPDLVEKKFPNLIFRDVPYDDAIEITLGLPDLTTEPVNQFRFCRATHPGLVY